MKQDFKIEIAGLKEVQDLLNNLPKSITDRVQGDIHYQAGKIVQDELKASAPDGDNSKKPKNKLENNVIIKRQKSSVLIGFNKRAFYVKWLEYGTIVRRILGRKKSPSGKAGFRKGKNTGKISPRPFVKQAHERAGRIVIDFLNRSYLNLIYKSIKKQNRAVQRAISKR